MRTVEKRMLFVAVLKKKKILFFTYTGVEGTCYEVQSCYLVLRYQD
jgi:hypothetical protein